MEDEIEKVRRSEQQRGRRPIDVETIDERRRIVASLLKIVRYGTIEDLQTAMREYGFSPESQQAVEILRIWREEREQS